MIRRGVMGADWKKRNLGSIWGLLWGWWDTVTGCPERFWVPQKRQCLRPLSSGIVGGVPSHGWGVGIMRSLRSRPTLSILWFCDRGLFSLVLCSGTLCILRVSNWFFFPPRRKAHCYHLLGVSSHRLWISLMCVSSFPKLAKTKLLRLIEPVCRRQTFEGVSFFFVLF